MKRVAKQYGLWKSSITPYVLSQGIRIADLGWDSDGETLVWLEERAGHGVLVAKHRKEAAHDLTCELSVRARVGYGGGDFTVSHGMIYFVADGRIYRQSLSAGAAQSVTPAYGQAASPCISPDGRWMLYVHSDGLEDVLAIVDVEGKLWPQKLVAGDDFYMQPCWHPSGEKIAWISWRHPQMPWEGTTAHLAKLDTGKEGLPSVKETRIIVGGESTCIFQPEFSPDGRYLAYISDESGFDSLYLYDLSMKMPRQLTSGKEELAMPAWIQGMRTYGFSYTSREIICRVSSGGINRLERVDIETGTAEQLEQFSDYTLLSQVVPSPTENAVALIAQSAVTPARVVTCTFTVQEQPRIHRYSTAAAIPDSELSTPEVVSWPAQDGGEVHGFYYQPRNEAFVGIGLPPVVIMVHGGPSSQYTAGYHGGTQFFSSRGYGVLEVNYRGSTGYGRNYREELNGKWGIIDVEDVISGAAFLAKTGRADSGRLAIMGGSAGGYTVLRVLTEHPGRFKAAVCLYGVSDLFTFAQDTHKFEAHYLDSLLGPLPEASEVYRVRSPIFSAQKIVDPIVIFQGEEDKVVPKDQSERLVASLKNRGIPYEYYLYAGEGHGFRKSETTESLYRRIEQFLIKHLLFA